MIESPFADQEERHCSRIEGGIAFLAGGEGGEEAEEPALLAATGEQPGLWARLKRTTR